MEQLGNGLHVAGHNEDALTVREAELSMRRRIGASEEDMLVVQTNLAITYTQMGRREEALQVDREVYSGRVKLSGEENISTLRAAINYATTLYHLKRFEEAKELLRKSIPVARRVLEESHDLTLRMRLLYAMALYNGPAVTLDDLREAVTTLEETERIARRVLGGAHPLVVGIEKTLRHARAALAAREAPPTSG